MSMLFFLLTVFSPFGVQGMESLCLVAILCGIFAIGCLCAGVHESAVDGGESDVGQRRGIGAMLVHAVVEEAGKQRVSALYLYTTGKENEGFYARLGWSVRERVDYLGKQRVIMEIAPCAG